MSSDTDGRKPLEVAVELNIEIPAVPNYVRLRTGRPQEAPSIPITDLSDEQLRKLGEAWTALLIERARKGRPHV